MVTLINEVMVSLMFIQIVESRDLFLCHLKSSDVRWLSVIIGM